VEEYRRSLRAYHKHGISHSFMLQTWPECLLGSHTVSLHFDNLKTRGWLHKPLRLVLQVSHTFFFFFWPNLIPKSKTDCPLTNFLGHTVDLKTLSWHNGYIYATGPRDDCHWLPLILRNSWSDCDCFDWWGHFLLYVSVLLILWPFNISWTNAITYIYTRT